MSMSFADRVRQRRRLEILLLLAQSPRYGASEVTLALGIEDRGVGASRDAVTADCAWLAEQGLVTVRPGVVIATQRGLDVSRGLARTPGVAAPTPEDLA